MRTYSDFFKTLYDETKPTGFHYSVLRAVVFHDQNGKPLSEGQLADFAVIWDEDRDERVMEPIEEIYRRGLLSSFLMFGETQAVFTAVLSDKVHLGTPAETDERIQFLKTEIHAICGKLDDAWCSQVVDRLDDVSYDANKTCLKNLEMHWKLGTKASRGKKTSKRLSAVSR
jgi:hypothetical protein